MSLEQRLEPAAAAQWSAQQLLGLTLPAVLLARVQRSAGSLAYRVKWRGLYRERSWLELGLRVMRFGLGLQRHGFQAGDRLAIMGDACEPWLIADLACQCLGGISYGIYPTASVAEVLHQMKDGGACLFVAENQEYVDKLLAVADQLPQLRTIIACDSSAMFAYDDPRLIDFVQFCRADVATDVEANVAAKAAAGRLDPFASASGPLTDAIGTEPDSTTAATKVGLNTAIVSQWLQHCAQQVKACDPAFIVYTSGTTGNPKGALISHGRHLAGTYNIVEHYPLLREPGLRTIAYLPMCHVLGRDIAITLPLLCGLVPHYGESVDDLATTLFDVAPQVLFTVPRYLQKFASQLLIGVSNSTPVKRRVFDTALRFARRTVSQRWQSQPQSQSQSQPRTLGARYWLAYQVALRPALNKIGFDAIRLLICGGAPLPQETMTFWHMLGVNVCEIYGQTETAGAIISGQRSPFPRPGDVGEIATGIQCKLAAAHVGGNPIGIDSVDFAAEGEIYLAGEYRFDVYWQAPQASADSFDDGWLKTGDVGRFDERRLKLIDRVRDFMVTAGGKTLSPTAIENAVRASSYVAEVMVIGHARKYVSALIEIDYDAVVEWARGRGLVYSGFTSLAEHAEVQKLIYAEIDKANQQLARVEQIKAFRILPKALDPEQEGEPVTPTRKVKRGQMLERFGGLVESMYDARDEELLLLATAAPSR